MNADAVAPMAQAVNSLCELVVALNSPLMSGELLAGSIMPYWFDRADCQRAPQSICLMAEAPAFSRQHEKA
jgi:hypothetical protein